MRKAVLALAALVVAGILAAGALARPEPATPPPSPSPATAAPVEPAAPPVEEHDDHAVPVDPEQDGPATRAAVEFATVFADRPTAAERPAWNAEMTRLADPGLAEGLHWAEAERLPDGKVIDSALLEISDTAAAVRVDLDTGEAWVVTVETGGAGWQATDVRPVE